MDFNRQFTITIVKDDTKYTIGPNTEYGIESGSMNLDEVLCENELHFGSMYATKFEVEIFNISEDVTGGRITVSVQDGTVKRSVFNGIIDSAIYDNLNISRKIVAYDRTSTLRSLDVSTWWNAYWQTDSEIVTHTLKEVRASLLASVGLTDPASTSIGFIGTTKSFINDSLVVRNSNYFTSLSFGEVLKRICELQCTFPHISRNGSLQFIQLPTVAKQIIGDYEQGTSEFEDYNTSIITGVGVYNTSDSLAQLVGTEENVYKIVGNIFLLQLDADELVTALTPIRDYLSNITYKPCNIKMIVSDLTLDLGSLIESDKGYHYVMHNSYSGSLLVEQTVECVSYGETLDTNVESYNDTMIQGIKVSSIEKNIDKIALEVSNATSDIDAASARIELLAGSITALVSEIDNLDGVTQELQSSIIQQSNQILMQVQELESDLITQQTTFVVKSDGAYIQQGNEKNYSKFTDSGMQIYSNANKIAEATSDTFKAPSFTTDHWTIREDNGVLCFYKGDFK